MLYTALGGIKGATFCSTLQLSHRFKMLSWSYNGGFFGNYLYVGKMVASIAQGQAPALNRQGGNVRVAVPYHVEFLFQNEYASYTGRSGRTSLCSRRLAPLSLKQDCFFRVPLPKLKCLVQFAFGGQRDFHPPINSPKAPFRQLSKVADASQPL